LQGVYLIDEILPGSGCFLQDLHPIGGISAASGLSLQGVAHIGWYFTRSLRFFPHRTVSYQFAKTLYSHHQSGGARRTDRFHNIYTHWHNTMYYTRADTAVQENVQGIRRKFGAKQFNLEQFEVT
jgi:hypothetical protein